MCPVRVYAVFVLLSFNTMGCFASYYNFGEICNNTDECNDHRLVCVEDVNKEWRCNCDRFHSWRGFEQGCFQTYNSSVIIKALVRINNNFAYVEKENKSIFEFQAAAGIFVFVAVLAATIVIIIYCMHNTKQTFKRNRILRRTLCSCKHRKPMAIGSSPHKSAVNC